MIVKAGLENGEIKKAVEKIRYYCKRIHCSSKLNEQLYSSCLAHSIQPRKIEMDMEIRWNSTYNMLTTSLKLKLPITFISSNLITEHDSSYELLNQNDWDLSLMVCELLEPFNQGNLKKIF